MAYTGKTITEIINLIGDNQVFLPSIQRKFVWEEHDAEKLFDSIMLGYPIGTFLFWKLNRQLAREKKFKLYKWENSCENKTRFNELKF